MPINTDQNCAIDPNADKKLSMPIKLRIGLDTQLLTILSRAKILASVQTVCRMDSDSDSTVYVFLV